MCMIVIAGVMYISVRAQILRLLGSFLRSYKFNFCAHCQKYHVFHHGVVVSALTCWSGGTGVHPQENGYLGLPQENKGSEERC